MAKRSKTSRRTSETVRSGATGNENISSGLASPSWWKIVFPAILIAAAGVWVYWPALRGDWLWDDSLLIRDNTRLRDLYGLYEIWFSAPATDYWPLSWTLLWLEWHFWEDQTVGYHLASLGLHLISAFLIWRLLSKLGLRRGWIGGLLFVVHPLAVESVAWMSEIKNTLSLPFFLLSLEALIETDETNSPWAYCRSFLFYLAAMLAKSSVITLPFVYLLYCWWKHDRIAWSDLIKMIPFLILALILGLITLSLQHIHTADTVADQVINSRGPLIRLIGAGMAIFFYLEKFVWPVDLLPIYPRWPIDSFSLLEIVTIPLLALLFYGCWTLRYRWGRHALLGFGFFVLTLLPVLGFFKMSYLSISWVADHLAYLSLVGLIGLAVAGMETAWLSVQTERFGKTLSAAHFGSLALLSLILILLAAQSRSYAARFTNGESLFSYNIHTDPSNWLAYNYLGLLLKESDRVPEAIPQFEMALKLRPNSAELHYNLACALALANRLPEAIDQFRESLKLDPYSAQTYDDWGAALVQEGKTTDAMTYFENAIRINPSFAQAHNDLANAFLSAGQYPEAISEYEKAIQIEPDVAVVHLNLGEVLEKLDRKVEAIKQFEIVLRLDPHNQPAKQNLDLLRGEK